MPKKTFLEQLTWKRARGRRREIWTDTVREYIEKRGEQPEDKLEERREWWRHKQRWKYFIHNSTLEAGNGK